MLIGDLEQGRLSAGIFMEVWLEFFKDIAFIKYSKKTNHFFRICEMKGNLEIGLMLWGRVGSRPLFFKED